MLVMDLDQAQLSRDVLSAISVPLPTNTVMSRKGSRKKLMEETACETAQVPAKVGKPGQSCSVLMVHL